MMTLYAQGDRTARHGQAGLTLVELMVAMAIGIFLMAGAITVFGKTRDLYRTNDAAARLQETARYAMSTIEADLRMANYWGLNSRADLVSNAAAPGETLPSALTAYQAAIDACGDNWAIDLNAYVDGNDNGYDLDCDPFGSGAVGATDVLVIRRASVDGIAPASLAASDGQLKVQTSRVQGALFGDDVLPGGYLPPLSETRSLVVHGYYVSQDSDARAGTPSLRRKRLDFDAAANVPVIVDEEITAGIEDLQFAIGYDSNGDQDADYFVNPQTVVGTADLPVAVRVWLLTRAEQPDFGFTDDRAYQYANRGSFTPGDRFRRILVSKTIALRNTRR
jgi:type IV pilus assembly protein PilW